MLLTVLMLLFASTAWAGDYEYGLAAYYKGDYVEATKWFKLAAAQGDENAQYHLGEMHREGRGALQDYAEAIRWYKLAADKGFTPAQYRLGEIYREGRDATQNYAEAIRWYKLAAALGNVSAQYELAGMHEKGQGTVRDYLRAHMWFNLASVKGTADVAENRDRIAMKMTSQQVREAQKLARECQARNVKNCD